MKIKKVLGYIVRGIEVLILSGLAIGFFIIVGLKEFGGYLCKD